MNEINEEKRKRMITKLRPRFIMALEHECVSSIYESERNRLQTEHEAALTQLDEEFRTAREIEKGFLFPAGTVANEMTKAIIKSQKQLNGLDPDAPLKIDEVLKIESNKK